MSRLIESARDRLVTRDASPTWWLTANVWLLGMMAWVLLVPVGRHHILIPLLGLSAAAGGLRLLASDPLQVEIRGLILFMAVAGMAPVLIGAFESTPGLADVAAPLVGGPIAWFAISNLADRWFTDRLPSLAAVATVILAVWLLMLVFDVGRSLLQVLDPTAYGTIDGGASRSNYIGSTSLIATVPMLGTILYDRFRSGVPMRQPALLLAGFIVGVLAVVVSGRQAVIGAVALLPVTLALTHLVGFRAEPINRRSWSRRDGAIGVGMLAAVAGAGLILGLRPGRLVGDFLDSLGIGGIAETARIGFSADVRSRQSASLLDGFGESPWVGKGAGAVSPEFHTWRGFELGSEFIHTPRPWRAELSYHLLLFEGGLLAIAAYAIAGLVALLALRQVFRRLPAADKTLLRATVVGSFAMAIATAADPLVRSVGQQWPLFMPAIVAAALMSRRSYSATADSTAGDSASGPPAATPSESEANQVIIDPTTYSGLHES